MDKLIVAIGGIVAFCAIIIGAIFVQMLVSLLGAYVIQDIARLFELDIVANMSLVQLFGAMIVFSVVTMNIKRKKSKGDDDIKKVGNSFLSNAIGCLIIWGMAYIAHYMLLQVLY